MIRDNDPNDRTVIERVDPLLGTVLDRRYRIEFKLAAGGFGAIYRARHVTSGMEVAIKVMHARLASDPGIVARFRREGATMTTLRNPHTITAYEMGETSDGTLFIVMELLHGVTLYDRVRVAGPFPWRKMVAIADAVCGSLAEAHALGIVHRDLKPTNIHLERHGTDEDYVKVLDFGIAKILQDSSFDSSDLTTAGQMVGTLDYMSPEQMVGGVVTGLSDLFTLGVVMYEMISLRRPFPEARNAATALAALLQEPPPLSALADVPRELDRVIARCLAKDAAHRYQTADELSAALRSLLVRDQAPVDDDATMISGRPMMPAPTPLFTIQTPPPQLIRQPGTTSAVTVPARAPAAARAASPGPSLDVTMRGMTAVPAVPRIVPPPNALPPPPPMPDLVAPTPPTVPRFVWIVVLVLAALIGVVAATQL